MIERPPMQRIRWLDVLNTTAEQIPAFAPMRVSDMDASTRLIKVAKANADGAGLYLFNGPQPIPANGKGLGTRSFPAIAYYDSGDGTPANGETWGPGNGSWKLRKNNTGYKAYGIIVSGLTMMVQPEDQAGGEFSGARATDTAGQSISASTTTVVTFNSERFDTDGYHSTSSNTGRLTVPATGYYLIGGNVRWAHDPNGKRRMQIRLNGSTVIASETVRANADPGTNVPNQSIATLYAATSGDYFELLVWQDSIFAVNITFSTTDSAPDFWIVRQG